MIDWHGLLDLSAQMTWTMTVFETVAKVRGGCSDDDTKLAAEWLDDAEIILQEMREKLQAKGEEHE